MTVFSREVNLHIDVDAYNSGQSPLLLYNSGQAVIDNSTQEFVLRDTFQLNLYFWKLISGVWTSVQTTGSVIVFAGKTAPGAASLLYSATGFAEDTDDDGNYFYYADLNLNTSELITAISTASSLATVVDIELQNAGNTSRTTFQFDLNILADVYRDEGAPTSGELGYPPPSALLLKYDGFATPDSTDYTVNISAHSLSAPPRVFIQIYSDAVISAVVKYDSVTATQFNVLLSSYAAGDNTKIHYFLISQ